MGYTTEFIGNFQLLRPKFDEQALYLLEFARTCRDRAIARSTCHNSRPWSRCRWSTVRNPAISSTSRTHKPQPRFKMKIVLLKDNPDCIASGNKGADGRGVEWNDREKFYRYVEWLQYLIIHFFVP